MRRVILPAGGEVLDRSDSWARCTVVARDNSSSQFVFSASRFDSVTSSYICQLHKGTLCRRIVTVPYKDDA